MAVTGQGTQESPYLVRSRDEIEEAFQLSRQSAVSGTKYVKLVKNIDGKWAQWQAIDFKNVSGNNIDFDFDNHEIANYYSEEIMFYMNESGDTFRNGRIYNIVSQNRYYVFIGGIKLVKMSISSKIYEQTGNSVLLYNEYSKCAVRLDIETFNPLLTEFDQRIVSFAGLNPNVPGSEYQSDTTDWMINIDNLNSTKFCVFDSGSGNQVIGENNRIRGKIGRITNDTITNYPAIADSPVAFENSVFSYEMPSFSGTVSSGQPTTIIGTGSTGIINSTLIHELTYANYTMLNLTPETDTDMHNADELTEDGFPVYVVNP